jgi:hypothetical protein
MCGWTSSKDVDGHLRRLSWIPPKHLSYFGLLPHFSANWVMNAKAISRQWKASYALKRSSGWNECCTARASNVL